VQGTSITNLDPELERLLSLRSERLVFQHPVWLRTWLAEFGDRCEPVFLAAGNGEQVQAVAPLMRADDRLTFIGDSSIVDFMDVLVAPGAEDTAYEALWGQICAEEWTELDLWGIPASSPTREKLLALARASGYGAAEVVEAVAPRVDLAPTWDEYLASLNKKDRHELRRKTRRLFDSGAEVRFDVLSEQAEVVAGIEQFLDLHTRSRMDKTEFMTGEMASFFRRMTSAMAACGLIRLFMLYVNSRPAAAVLCFDAGSHIYMYNSGYDPEFSGLAVGLVSKALCLQWAIENGKTGADFLRGNESYKYDLGAKDQEIYRLVVRRPA
jgi:CelD/BcsL family acetyltransferase involved in cellulose biosynthesis